MKRYFFGALAVLTAVGCATTPVPADKISRSQAAVKSAEELNAANDPQAALHLKLAKEQLHQAKGLMKDGQNDQAKTVLSRAEADGEAALNIARAKSAQLEATKTIQSIQQAKSQLSQEGPRS